MNRDRLNALSDSDLVKIEAKAQAMLADGDEKQRALAQRVVDDIASITQQRIAERVEHVASLSPSQRIVEAFTIQPPTDTEVKVIRALGANPGATSEGLSKASGWRKGSAWHLHFGTMCFNRRAFLWPAPPAPQRGEDQFFYSGILADYDTGTHGFTLKPEAVAAFTELRVL